jgi:eukaryotic-like serine/threonine-protein kinase
MPVPDPVVDSSDAELRARVDSVLSANYELDREIGRGGMGIVYKAKDRRLKRHVAIKLLPPELAYRSDIRSRFLKEAETAAQLSHPNIVPIYSVDERDGLVFFVMAFVAGENLAVRLHRRGALPADETRRIMLEVARALSYAHERGVVHRDIKPDNILMSEDEDERVMVTDFGIARAVSDSGDSRLTATGMAIGTPAYMSPEQSMGEREIDGRSDLYALGVVAYQMLSGELPFNAPNTPSMLVKHISERPAPIEEKCSDLPSDLGRAVMMCLEKEPANRFPTAEALAVALETGEVPDAPARDDYDEPAPVAVTVRGARGREARRTGATTHGVMASPDADEIARWNAPQVQAFRKKLAPFFAVSGVLVFLQIINVLDMAGLAGLWSVYIAFQYAKLWTDGFDWRDVFKQPRERLFFDVVAESIDDFRALFDPKKRAEVRERDRLRVRDRGRGNKRGIQSGAPALAAGDLAAMAGPHAAKVRKAAQQRDDIVRLVGTLPKREREQIADVPSTAVALYQRIEALAFNLADLERSAHGTSAAAVEEEIARLESEANPLDHDASEERIRRLALLKRQRRAIADVERRRSQAAAKLESCVLALQNMQLDVLRLKTGGQSYQQITLVAERAMSLAREVDNAVYVADEMAKLRGTRGSDRGARG